MLLRKIEDPKVFLQLLLNHFSESESKDSSGSLSLSKLKGNLILSTARRMVLYPSADHQMYIITENGDFSNLLLAAEETPPYNPIIGFGDSAAVQHLANYFAEQCAEYPLPGLVADDENCNFFNEIYLSKTGAVVEKEMKQHLHFLSAYQSPNLPVGGKIIIANESHLSFLVDWQIQFAIDANLPHAEASREAMEKVVKQRLSENGMFLWEVEMPPNSETKTSQSSFVSMASVSPCGEDTVRVGMVYTPAVYRNHGYASMLVNVLSKSLLDQGKNCLLYSDASNVASNRIYYDIGYRVISHEKVMEYRCR
jgi:ribosomal protein S18 acetylase RimI-like enzyme